MQKTIKVFCVEYDLEFLKNETKLDLDYHQFFDNTNDYLNERLLATIKS